MAVVVPPGVVIIHDQLDMTKVRKERKDAESK